MAMLTGVGVSGLAGVGYTLSKIYRQCIGFAKVSKIPQKRGNYGNVWVGPGPTLKNIGESSQNIPMLLIFWGSIPCVFCVYIIKGC